MLARESFAFFGQRRAFNFKMATRISGLVAGLLFEDGRWGCVRVNCFWYRFGDP